jgi:hypothetical protein
LSWGVLENWPLDLGKILESCFEVTRKSMKILEKRSIWKAAAAQQHIQQFEALELHTTAACPQRYWGTITVS